MDYQVDIDPAHSVIRLTITADIVTSDLAEHCYRCLSLVASHDGPYAAIYDLSAVKHSALTIEAIMEFAHRAPAVPMGRTHVVVGKQPCIYGLARAFQICREVLGYDFEVVHSLEEAYEIVGVRPEDFTVRVFPKVLAA